jgi:RNA polymerase sigma-70 factor (ECF subfamily)
VDARSLVERAQRGDHAAFETLAAASVSRLLGAATLILRDRELARDATQDALIRAWRDLPTLRDPDRFDAWLHRLAVNSCLDLTRRRRRRVQEVEIGTVDEPVVTDETATIADRELIDRALHRLTPDGRAVVVLHYYLGMDLPEVAAMLGIPTGTAKSRLHRSLATMRILVEAVTERPGADLREGQPA